MGDGVGVPIVRSDGKPFETRNRVTCAIAASRRTSRCATARTVIGPTNWAAAANEKGQDSQDLQVENDSSYKSCESCLSVEATRRNRTANLRITNALLYLLS